MKQKVYDIFISYRRDGGFETASLIAEKLRSAGYSVFFDIDTLRAGKFNEQLYHVIGQCKDFIVVLPKDGLERCVNETDWVRQEVVYALRHNKNMIPVMLREFQWPETMPAGLEELQHYQGVAAGDYQFFDASVSQLKSYLKSKRGFTWQKYKLYFIGVVVLLSLVAGVFLWNNYKERQYFTKLCIEQTNLMGIGISSVNHNLNIAKSARDGWNSFRKKQLNAKPQDADLIRQEFIQWIDLQKKSALPPGLEYKISDATAEVLSRNGVNVTEIKAFYSMALPRDAEGVLSYLDYLQVFAREPFITGIKDQYAQSNYDYLECAGKSTYYYFLGLLTTMPQDVYADFRKMRQHLNNFSEIPLELSFEEYESQGDAMSRRAEEVVKTMESRVDVEDESTQKIRNQLEQIEKKIDAKKENAEKEIDARIRNIQKLSADVVEKHQLLQETETKIEESLRSLIEKCKLSPDDDQYLMWGKIVRIATSMARTAERRMESEKLNRQDKAAAEAKGLDVSDRFEVKYSLTVDEMLQEIHARLEQYMKYFPEAKSYVPAVKEFYREVKDGKQTLNGIIVVGTKDDVPHPVYKVGDIVIARKGKPMNSTEEYKSTATTAGEDQVTLLRINGGKLQKRTEAFPKTEVLVGFLVMKEE
ncbi:MAG: TIR domain-containing protein [Tannerella sp.]|jgi:hypothetical protein|nr:TIR domain-containing protein [Tannerella sp.]